MVRGTGRASLRWRWPQSTDACDTGWWPDYSTASSSPHHPDHRRLQLTYEAEIQTVQLVTNKQDCDGGHHGVICRYPISYGHQGLFQSPSRGLTSPEELNHSFVHHNLVVLFAELLQSVEVFQRLIVPPSLWTVYSTLSLIWKKHSSLKPWGFMCSFIESKACVKLSQKPFISNQATMRRKENKLRPWCKQHSWVINNSHS